MLPTAAFHARQTNTLAGLAARSSAAKIPGLLYPRILIRQSFTPVHHYIKRRQDFYPILTLPAFGLRFALPIKQIVRIQGLVGTRDRAKRSIYKEGLARVPVQHKETNLSNVRIMLDESVH